MACQTVSLPGGGKAIVCGTTPKCKCGRRAPLLCDWKVPEKKSGTCDKPICARCATSPAPDKDICPDHAAALAAWQNERRAG